MQRLRAHALATLLCVFWTTASWSAVGDMGDQDLFALTLDELVDIEISVASIGPRNMKEQSAIVSVITARDISASGARDLVDVLRLVPGFHFGVDVEGITGVGIRGFWAYEGKVLITLDGIDLVEYLYGVVPLGEHIPVDIIERIEIIRGPGSAMYGGNAELSVINIVTKGAKLNGGFVNATVGTDGEDVSGRMGAAAGLGDDDFHLHFGGSWGSSYRSTSHYVDNDGVGIDLDGNSAIEALLLNAGVDYKDLVIRFLYDAYDVDDAVNYGWVVPRYQNDFESFGVSAKYDFEVSEALRISPKLSYAYQEPWHIDIIGDEYFLSTQRYTANLTATGELGAHGPADSIELLGGAEFYWEHARADLVNELVNGRVENVYYGGHPSVDYQNYAAFLQAEFDSQWADLTVGGRYHHHSRVGEKFVPRVALTRAWDKFHAKALFSQAFRTPQIEVIQYGGFDLNGHPKTKPETTTSYELEAGYRVNEKLSGVVSAFWIDIADILVYSSVSQTYHNFDAVTNYGLEAEMRFADDWGSVAIGYSFYRNYRSDVPAFCTAGPVFYLPDYSENPAYAGCGQRHGLLLGFPAHKLTFNGTYRITDRLSLNLNGDFISKRISYAVGMLERRTLSPQVYANLFLQYQWDDFSVGFGIRDLFDQEYAYAQPFDSGVRELPGKGREFFLKASYTFDGMPFD